MQKLPGDRDVFFCVLELAQCLGQNKHLVSVQWVNGSSSARKVFVEEVGFGGSFEGSTGRGLRVREK